MPNIVAVDLDLISESQALKADTANNLFDAMSSAALFGVKSLDGLSLVLYGGVMIVLGVPTSVATQTITLSNNATNYIYSTFEGEFVKVTSAPSGWPGPIVDTESPAREAIALYRIVTDDGFATDDFDVYVPSMGMPGIQGDQGIQGDPGVHLAAQRIRWATWTGSSATNVSLLGFTALTNSGATATARTLASSSLRASIPYTAYVTAAGANSSGYIGADRVHCFRGNAAGRGGFTTVIRFCLESTSSPATFRCFFGMFTTAVIGNVEPDTLVNVVGVGSKGGDANLSIFHNDGTGTATIVALGSNFPARSTDNVYEFTITCEPNASTMEYSLLDVATGNIATGTLSTNLPDDTAFLCWTTYCANVGTASAAAYGLMQVVSTSRY